MSKLEKKLNKLKESLTHDGQEYKLFISRTSGLWGSVVGWEVAYATGTYYCDEECTEGHNMLLHSCGSTVLEDSVDNMLHFLDNLDDEHWGIDS